MPEASPSGRTRPVAAGLSDVGRQRRHNEDHVLVRPELGLYVVADGMGGHNAGDVASKLTTTSLGNFFEATQNGEIPKDFQADCPADDPDAKRLVAAVKKANRDVFVISTTHQQHHGMGSTVVSLHISSPNKLHIAHVGDSRCYRVRNGKIEQLTRDHSLINDAIDLKPDLTEEELARLPKNIITRALGMKDQVKVDIRTEAALLGDIYLLCSDGLSGMINDKQILEILAVTDEPQEACELLVAEANEAGGTDNISALIIRINEDKTEWNDVTTPMLDPAMMEPLDDEALPAGVMRKLSKGEEVDLDIHGAWNAKPTMIPRCGACRHELFPGNEFCVECGTPIEGSPEP